MDRRAEIQELLNSIERKHDVSIIHAIESGSRAWGFPSADSDFDIRFIYVHPESWYLSAFDKKDTIDLAIDDELDAAGWDLGKCMRLLNKGNAPLCEWIFSPVIYQQKMEKFELFRELATEAFNPKPAFYHYMSLAKKKLLDEKTKANTKYYLYALRALLCAKWIAEESQIPPVDVLPLIDRYMSASEVNQTIFQLIENKKGQTEKENVLIPEVLLDFANKLYADLLDRKLKGSSSLSIDRYDQVMSEIIRV